MKTSHYADINVISIDYPVRIKVLRERLGLTQEQMADIIGVSFATVNRWENQKVRPSFLAWQKILLAEQLGIEGLSQDFSAIDPRYKSQYPIFQKNETAFPPLDFSADPEIVLAVAEGERLRHGHLFNPAFAAEISIIDPLPHQRIAVYERMLPEPRLRFLLADDAGAGKTIMAGLYIREMLSRRLIKRVLIVSPAGLLGNWKRELRNLFNLSFEIVIGANIRSQNPFVGPGSNQLILSIDTLLGERMFKCLQEADVIPYDLVIFDEAHKLSANREPDLSIRKTDRYRLSEALAGIHTHDPRWQLSWCARHLLLLTATPHMGKDFPYYYLWRLLEPEALPTYDAFEIYPEDAKKRHFIRRTKEEMVRYDGSKIYPKRITDTHSYDLSQGEISEQNLYYKTTEYIQTYYNKAKFLNRSAARFAMGIFQRRLASSTYALLRSLERRVEKLENWTKKIRSGEVTMEELFSLQNRLEKLSDPFEEHTADEEESDDGREQNECAQEELIEGIVATTLAELEIEKKEVEELRTLAGKVHERGEESKFEKLRELLRDEKYKDEKAIIFTEHRDTLNFLLDRMESLGLTGKVASIHGGMDFKEREAQVEFFKKPLEENGAIYLIATDAAGEGINLQFCWLMVNYDIPWNPARLEQRMGRIHRYGQKHDPVIIMNLVAGKTREGKVLMTLLEKLKTIADKLRSDKVYDVIGRLFHEFSLKSYMENVLTDEGVIEAEKALNGILTEQQVLALQEKEQFIFGKGMEIAQELPRLCSNIELETYCKLLPGYVARFLNRAAPILGISLKGDINNKFSFRPLTQGALDPFLPILEQYPPERRPLSGIFDTKLTVYKPGLEEEIVFLHPGEPLFDRIRSYLCQKFEKEALKGSIFIDPLTERPYLFHLVEINVERKADHTFQDLKWDETVECRLIGLKQYEGMVIEDCPVEHLLLLKGGGDVTGQARLLYTKAEGLRELARAYALDAAEKISEEHRQRLLATLPERENLILRGYDYQEAELAKMRRDLSEKVQAGSVLEKGKLAKVKEQQRQLEERRNESIAPLRKEPELIHPGEIRFIAHALVVPSRNIEDKKRYDKEIETIAVRIAWGYEEGQGAIVTDVSTPAKARGAALSDCPGFDLLSKRTGGETLSIEVKGRAGIGDIELTENEWAKACNLRNNYWLYVVYDCATPTPQLFRIQDPFGKLLFHAKGGVVIDEQEIFNASDQKS